MGDGVKVYDTREELLLPVGFRGPISDLLQDLGIASPRTIEARGVDKCDFLPCVLERVRFDLASGFFQLTLESNYSRGVSYKYQDQRSF